MTLVLALLASAAVWAVRRPEGGNGRSAEQVTVPPMGIAVGLSRPGGGHAPAVIGLEAWFDVEVVAAEPVAGIELWAGDTLVAGDDLSSLARVTHVTRRLAFVPGEVGTLTLVARAADASGRAGQSQAIRLAVSEPYGPAVFATVEATAGESLDDIAARTGTTADLLEAANPQLALGSGLPAGTQVGVPVLDLDLDGPLPPDAVPPELRDLPPPASPGDAAEPTPPPSAVTTATGPQLTTALDDCELSVGASEVPDGTDGVAVHLLAPHAQHFTVTASLATDESWTATLAPGDYTVAVSAFSDAGHRWSEPAVVTVPEHCGGQQDGEVQLDGGRLTGGERADLAYVYLSVDGDTWQRVPQDPNEFVSRSGDGFDLSDHLPDLSGQDLEIDAWGWRGSQLVHIGRGHVTVPTTLDINAIIGFSEAVSLWWVEDPGGAQLLRRRAEVAEATELTFSWSTAVAGATGGTWQVARSPSAPSALEPADLVAQGQLENTTGTFAIDFAEFVDDPGGDTAVIDLGPEQFYVRVLPLAGDRPVGEASPTVPVTIGPSLPQLLTTLELEPRQFTMDIEVVPPRAPNLWRMGCYQLVRWDPEEVDAAALQRAREGSLIHLVGDPVAASYRIYLAILSAYGQDAPICGNTCYPTSDGKISLSGDACDDGGNALEQLGEALVDLVTMVWDEGIVPLFNQVKTFVVENLSKFSGCEDLAKISGVSDEDAKTWCNAAANAIVSSVMAAYGIPPTLPTSSDLINAAKGDLTALAVEYATAIGVPCDEISDASAAAAAAGEDIPTCDELVADLLDEFQDVVSEQFRSRAASYGLHFPPGAIVVPHPDGLVTPATVTFDLEPLPEPGEACPVTLLSYATWTPDRVVPSDDSLEAQVMRDVGLAFGAVEDDEPRPPVEWMAETAIYPYTARWPVELPPDEFSGAPFLPATRELPHRGNAVVWETNALGIDVPRRYATQLYEVGWYPPVDIAARLTPRSGWMTRTVPYESLLLHEGAEFTVTALSSCAGVASKTVTVPDVPGRVRP